MEDSLKQKALELHQMLVSVYGDSPSRPRLDPVSEMVHAILSQNTNDRLRGLAFKRLRKKFPTWEAVRDAPVEEIEEAIHVAGLSAQKARRIKEALQRLTEERGEISLDFLRDMGVEEARKWLTSFNGIGPKTAAIILLFSLDEPAFPVDTHVHRVSRRLGLIGPNVSREKGHVIMERIVPPELYYTFHLNLTKLGREVCHARKPDCNACVLKEICNFHKAWGEKS